MAWTMREALAASDAWRWVPPEAAKYDVEGVQVIDYPDWAFTGFYVTPLATGLSPNDVPRLVARIQAVAAEKQKSATTWWISPSTRPATFGDALVAAGGRLTETCDIYAYDMTDGMPSVAETGGVEAKLVTDEASLDDFALVGGAASRHTGAASRTSCRSADRRRGGASANSHRPKVALSR